MRLVRWICLVGLAGLAAAQPCGLKQALKPWQQNALAAQDQQLRIALATQDSGSIRQLYQARRLVLGTEAGFPALAVQGAPLGPPAPWLSQEQVLALLNHTLEDQADIFDHLDLMARGYLPGSQGTAGQPNLSPVAAGEYALALLQTANLLTDEKQKVRYLDLGLKTLDQLEQLAESRGTFPYPQLEGQRQLQIPPVLQRYYAYLPGDSLRLPAARPWQWEPDPLGQDLYANGRLCGVYVQAYAETNYDAYKQTATQLATWLLAHPPVVAARYNADLIYGLAYAYSLQQDERYLQRALAVCRQGLLPAQLAHGVWMDSLDAQPQAHARILEGMAALLRQLPKEHADRPHTVARFAAAVRYLLQQYRACGNTAGLDWALAVHSVEGLPAELQDDVSTLIGQLTQQTEAIQDIPVLARYARQLATANLTDRSSSSGQEATLTAFPVTPNPFQDYAMISFEVPERCPVVLKVLNAKGKQLAVLIDEEREAGIYHIRWDSSRQPDGAYLFQLTLKGRAYLRKADLKR